MEGLYNITVRTNVDSSLRRENFQNATVDNLMITLTTHIHMPQIQGADLSMIIGN